MRIVVDMNLSPRWAVHLAALGHDAVHWSDVGNPSAADVEVLDWACAQGRAVLTHDLDFTDILAQTRASAPSVLQVRFVEPTPGSSSLLIGWAIDRHGAELARGAIVSIDRSGIRVRALPIR